MLSVRPASVVDVSAIARVDVETWRATYAGVLPDHVLVGLSERQRSLIWQRFIVRRPGDTMVAVENGSRVVGFGSCGVQREPEIDFGGEVFTLYVTPDYQGKGIGRDLLVALFARLVRSGLHSAVIWVIEDNPSRFFYERVGGRRVAQRRIDMGNVKVDAVAYGWPDLVDTINSRAKARSRID